MITIRIQDEGLNQMWTWIGSKDGNGKGKMEFGGNCVVKVYEVCGTHGIVWNQQVFSAKFHSELIL